MMCIITYLLRTVTRAGCTCSYCFWSAWWLEKRERSYCFDYSTGTHFVWVILISRYSMSMDLHIFFCWHSCTRKGGKKQFNRSNNSESFRCLWEEVGRSLLEGLEKGCIQGCVSFTYIFFYFTADFGQCLIYLCHYIFVFINFSHLRRVYSFLGYMKSISLFSVHILVYHL